MRPFEPIKRPHSFIFGLVQGLGALAFLYGGLSLAETVWDLGFDADPLMLTSDQTLAGIVAVIGAGVFLVAGNGRVSFNKVGM